jgi:hypothetical protein
LISGKKRESSRAKFGVGNIERQGEGRGRGGREMVRVGKTGWGCGVFVVCCRSGEAICRHLPKAIQIPNKISCIMSCSFSTFVYVR